MHQGYKVLQYGSGVLGLLYLSWWTLLVYRRATPHADLSLRWREPARRLGLLLLLFVVPLGCLTAAYGAALHRVAPNRFLHEFVYRGITMTFAAMLVVCIAWRVLFALPSCTTSEPPSQAKA